MCTDTLDNSHFLLSSCVFKLISGSVPAYDQLWFLGDNFMATSYRVSFKKSKQPMFIKANFDVIASCSSRFSNNNTNMLSRISSSLAKTINEQIKMPKYVVVVLDKDLIEYLNFDDCGAAGMYGEWLEWLVQKITNLCQQMIDLLPQKAIKEGYPQIYWVAPPQHCNFTDNRARSKFVSCLETVLKDSVSHRIIRMKEIWNYENSNLVDVHGRMLPDGYAKYWQSIDAAVRFNAHKHDQYRARVFCQKNFQKPVMSSQTVAKGERKDDIQKFFDRRRNRDKYRWNKSKGQVQLPKPCSPEL